MSICDTVQKLEIFFGVALEHCFSKELPFNESNATLNFGFIFLL